MPAAMLSVEDVLMSAGYFAQAVPFALVAAKPQWVRVAPRSIRLLALAFFVSFLQDTAALQLGHFGLNNWWLGYVAYPVQFGLFLAAIAPYHSTRRLLLLALATIAAASAVKGPFSEPELFTRWMGGLVVTVLVWKAEPLRRFRKALVVYCGFSLPFLLGMVAIPFEWPGWQYAWWGHQFALSLGLALFLVALVRGKEVADGGPQGRGLQVGRELGARVPGTGARAGIPTAAQRAR